MPKVRIQDSAFDGEYDLDFNDRQFNGWELHIIKTVAGLRPTEFDDALETLDYDLVIAFAVIALLRAGKIDKRRVSEAADLLMDAESGKISIVADEAAAASGDALPPVSAPDGRNADSANATPSGKASNGTSDHPETIPTATGPLAWATGAT